MSEITDCLDRLRGGEGGALDRVAELVYDDLYRMARIRLSRERQGHTLSPTALVHEAYLTLVRQRQLSAENRNEFLAVAANIMRRLLVDSARARTAAKRGAGAVTLPLHEVEALVRGTDAEELLHLDDALRRFAARNPRGAEIVQQKIFGGLTLRESASLLGVSTKTIQREWVAAIAWIRKEIAAQRV